MTDRTETLRQLHELLDTVFERWWRTTVHGQHEGKEGLRLAFKEGAIVVATVLKESRQQELTAAQALAEQYRKALEEFGMHKDNCAKNLDPFFEISCDCGLDAALSAKS